MEKGRRQGLYFFWIAWRQIASSKRRGLSFMTVISVLGVAIGVAALVLVLSVMGGFENDLKSKMFKGLPHIEVMASNQTVGFSLQTHPLETFRAAFPKAVGIEPFTKSDVVLKKGKNHASVTLFGIEPELGGKLWGFSSAMTSGSLASLSDQGHEKVSAHDKDVLPKIVLGESLAIQLGADLGDRVAILSPQSSVGDVLSGGIPSMFFEIIGIFQTDLPRYDSQYAVVSLEYGRKFMPDYDYVLEEEEWVSGVALNFSDPEEITFFDKELDELPGLMASSWKIANKSLLFALKLEKFTMGAILLLIVLVATFSISGTMMMTVYHKRPQVALLKSLGMETKEIAKLFLTHGFTIGSLGVILGLFIGVGLCMVLWLWQLDLPPDVYNQKTVPVKFLPVEYCVICLSALVLSLLAALYPALVAAKQDPGSGLRFL